MRTLLLAVLLCASAQGQILRQVMQAQPVVATATPGLVNILGAPSTETHTMAGRVAGTVTCVANGYCTHLAQPSLSGNTIVVFYTYMSANTTAEAPTITDDKSGGSSTYTCITEANDASGTTRTFAGICYTLSAAANIYAITMTMPVATTTQGAAAAAQFNNVNAVDVSHSNGTQSASTSWSAGAMTTTANGDMVCEIGVGTSTRTNVTGFTAASGFSLNVADRRDALAIQCGVQTSAGSITPTITGQSNAYAAAAVSFKAASQGTAPSGMYIVSELHQSTATSATGPFTMQTPDQGANLLVVASQCGSPSAASMQINSISDGTNTWKPTGPFATNPSTQLGGSNFYAANVTGSATNTLTITTANTGDCTFVRYAIAGAAVDPWTGHVDSCRGTVASGSGNECLDGSLATIIGATFSPFTLNSAAGFFPGNSAGINIGTIGLAFNTAISATSPTGVNFKSCTRGGESLSGPDVCDENNGWLDFSNSDNTPETYTYGFTSSTQDVSSYAAVQDGFAAATATKYPTLLQSQVCTGRTSGTALASCSITPLATGHTLVIMVSDGGSSAHTISLTDSAANTVVTCSGATCSGSTTSVNTITSTGSMKLFYILSTNGTSADTFTFTWSGAQSYRTAWILELANVTARDFTSINLETSNGSTGAFTSASTGTLSTAHEIVLGWNICTGSCSPPTSGANLARWDSINGTDSAGQYSEWFETNATTAVTASFVDSSHGANEGAGIVTFK